MTLLGQGENLRLCASKEAFFTSLHLLAPSRYPPKIAFLVILVDSEQQSTKFFLPRFAKISTFVL